MIYPKVVLAVQVDLGAVGDRGTNVCPWPNNAACTVNGNLATGGEAVVSSIRFATNERGIVGVCADAAASHRVGVSIDSCGCCQQRNDEVAHRGRWSKTCLCREAVEITQRKKKQGELIDIKACLEVWN
jgi:hypothetical protein